MPGPPLAPGIHRVKVLDTCEIIRGRHDGDLEVVYETEEGVQFSEVCKPVFFHPDEFKDLGIR